MKRCMMGSRAVNGVNLNRFEENISVNGCNAAWLFLTEPGNKGAILLIQVKYQAYIAKCTPRVEIGRTHQTSSGTRDGY